MKKGCMSRGLFDGSKYMLDIERKTRHGENKAASHEIRERGARTIDLIDLIRFLRPQTFFPRDSNFLSFSHKHPSYSLTTQAFLSLFPVLHLLCFSLVQFYLHPTGKPIYCSELRNLILLSLRIPAANRLTQLLAHGVSTTSGIFGNQTGKLYEAGGQWAIPFIKTPPRSQKTRLRVPVHSGGNSRGINRNRGILGFLPRFHLQKLYSRRSMYLV